MTERASIAERTTDSRCITSCPTGPPLILLLTHPTSSRFVVRVMDDARRAVNRGAGSKQGETSPERGLSFFCQTPPEGEGGSPLTCQVCGTRIGMAGKPGRPPKYCDECRKSERKRKYYRYEPAPARTLVCAVCSKTFLHQGCGTPLPCPKCSDEFVRARRRHHKHAYRARLRRASVNTDVTPAFIASLRRSSLACDICSSLLSDDAHLDHIIPLAAGGTHTRDNLRFLCPSCNCSRPSDGSDVIDHQLNIWMAA